MEKSVSSCGIIALSGTYLNLTVSKLLLNRCIGPEVPKIEFTAVSLDMPSGL